MKGKVTAVLVIIVFLLIVAVICTFLTSMDRNRLPEPTPAPAVLVTPAPAVVAIETPAPTNRVLTPSAPSSVNMPAQATQPPAEPTPAPAPETTPFEAPSSTGGTALGSGSFRSSTGSNIDIRTEWEAVTSGTEQVEVTVTVYLESYGLHMQAMPNTVNISLNGQYASLGAPAVDYDGSAQISTKLASTTFTIECRDNESRDMGLQAEWHFNGTYGGVDIPVIECGGQFVLSR